MAEPSRRRRRRTSEASKSNTHQRDATIEGWLSDEQDQHSTQLTSFTSKHHVQGQKVGYEDEDIHMLDPTHVAGPSQVNEEYSLESLSRQMSERGRLQHEMIAIQNTRHDEICTNLKSLDERISGLKRHFDSDVSDEF
ncbi:hypothetical protein V8G54_035742 [Vigna mungo]|uniref:Uncharacterized protein n=1 Tax=Vigna mungo TaxID=3915 RepID=A0AAQ3RBH8_VIGMU